MASLKILVDKADLTKPQERYHRCVVTQRKFNPDGFIVEVKVKRDTLTVLRQLYFWSLLVICTGNSFGICKINYNLFILYPLFIYFKFFLERKESWSHYLGLLLHTKCTGITLVLLDCWRFIISFFFLHLLLVTNWIFLFCIFSLHFDNIYLLFLWRYLELQACPWTEVCLFFRDFIGIGLLIFSGTQHGFWGLFSVVCNRAGFSRKKEPKNRSFWMYWNT